MWSIHAVEYYSAMERNEGTSLVVPALGLLPSKCRMRRFHPGWGTGIPHFSRSKRPRQNKDSIVNRFNKNFENGPHPKKKKSLKETRNEVLTHATTWVNLGSVKRKISLPKILWLHLCQVSRVGRCSWLVARSWGRGRIGEGPWWARWVGDDPVWQWLCSHSCDLWINTKSLNCTLLTGGTTSFVNYMSIRLFF